MVEKHKFDLINTVCDIIKIIKNEMRGFHISLKYSDTHVRRFCHSAKLSFVNTRYLDKSIVLFENSSRPYELIMRIGRKNKNN